MGFFKDPRMDMVFDKTWDSVESHCAKVAMSRADEIKRLKIELDQYRALGSIGHLRELVQAENDGRLHIGRCIECKKYDGLAVCKLIGDCGGTNFYCGWFEPREEAKAGKGGDS